MSALLNPNYFAATTAVSNIITEDGEPVDNILSEKQQRLLVDALYESWIPSIEDENNAGESEAKTTRTFWAAANVGVFRSMHLPGVAPDVFISLDVTAPRDLRETEQRSYFMWDHGKAPEVVIEIVSNRKGRELDSKIKEYAQMGATYYVVFDPMGELGKELQGAKLHVYELGFGKRFRLRRDTDLPELGLSLMLWEGEFEGSTNSWLRWRDKNGELLLTGHERAAQMDERAAHSELRAEKLAAKLRELGIDPEKIV